MNSRATLQCTVCVNNHNITVYYLLYKIVNTAICFIAAVVDTKMVGCLFLQISLFLTTRICIKHFAFFLYFIANYDFDLLMCRYYRNVNGRTVTRYRNHAGGTGEMMILQITSQYMILSVKQLKLSGDAFFYLYLIQLGFLPFSSTSIWSCLLICKPVLFSCGGNYLLNVGPTHDGRILPIFEERLRQMGAWLKVNGEAVYNSTPWKYQNDTVSGNVW